jgi:hypothetical protein
MIEVVELRNAASTLRQWAKEIRHESVPAPYATVDEDIGIRERVAGLLELPPHGLQAQATSWPGTLTGMGWR